MFVCMCAKCLLYVLKLTSVFTIRASWWWFIQKIAQLKKIATSNSSSVVTLILFSRSLCSWPTNGSTVHNILIAVDAIANVSLVSSVPEMISYFQLVVTHCSFRLNLVFYLLCHFTG